jgi:hypothetical protein
MSSYQEITCKIGDRWVAALKRSEDAVASIAENVRGKIDLSQIPLPEQITKLNEALTERLPMPSEIVQARFELTERLLSAQRDLTLRLLALTGSASDAEAETANE